MQAQAPDDPSSRTGKEEGSELWSRLWSPEAEAAAAACTAAYERMSDRPAHFFSVLTTLGLPGTVPPSAELADVVETRQIRESAQRQLQEAVSTMQADETADLLLALTRAPELVQKESNPMRFLRCENYNPWAAAAGLARYWTFRREVFKERAFLPLNLTRDGALDEDSVGFIRNGSNRILPADSTGRTVLLVESSRRIHHGLSTRLQANFYLAHVVSENPVSQTSGFVAVFSESVLPKIDDLVTKSYGVFTNFPIRSPLCLFYYCVPRSSHSLYAVLARTCLRLGLSSLVRQNKAFIHITDDKNEALQKFKSHGLTKEGLPVFLGGAYCYEDHVRWVMGRMLTDSSPHQYNVAGPWHSPSDVKIFLSEIYSAYLPLAMNEIAKVDKLAHLRALERAPALVEKESNMEDLLLSEDYHIVNACRRLGHYWELRSKLFGDRALLVMNQTGEGALSRADWAVLRTGFVMLLPNDTYGRSVVAVDPAGLDYNDYDHQAVYRSFFYMLSVASENPTAPKKGIVLLLHVPSFQRPWIKIDMLRSIVMALPVQVAAVHLSGVPTNGSPWVDGLNFGWKPMVHTVSPKTMLATALAPYGLPSSGLPVSLGGSWHFSNFLQWQELRMRCEWDLPTGPTAEVGYPGLQPRIRSSESSEVEQKRRMEVVIGRRRRNQVHAETVLLQEHVLLLQEQQRELVTEQGRLECLIRLAELLVNLGDLQHI